MQRLVEKIAAGLLQQQAMLCCAESCTGGWIAKSCTDLAGSSAWFDRGFVTYSNQAKQEMLGVPETLILEHGAVSEPVVRTMVQGALQHSRAQYAVAVSGIAGPGGGSAEKPVGTVWLGWGNAKGELLAVCEHFPGDRKNVRKATVYKALLGLLALIGEKNVI
jgi:nicotinamide-nucleotide amidase